MDAPPYRRTERACVALYVLVALGSLLTYAWTASPWAPTSPAEPDPTVGVAFLAIGLFWLCVLLATAMVLALLAVNAVRVRHGVGADGVVVVLALAIPVCLLAGAAALVYVNYPRFSMVLGILALGVVPVGLLAATFGDRYRRDSPTAP